MKIHPILLVAITFWIASPLAQAAPAGVVAERPVLWSVHFDAERLRRGVGQDLFARLDPMLTSVSGDNAAVPGGKLESVAVSGFQPHRNGGEPIPFLADVRFSSEGGGISRRFEAVSKKHGVPIEEIAGVPTIHSNTREKKSGSRRSATSGCCWEPRALCWKLPSRRVGGGFPVTLPTRPTEMLGGKIEIEPLLAANPALRDSQLLKLLPHVEFHLLSEGGQLDLDASAQLDSERSAKRAARMIDGMVAALSMHDAGGVPWDERLVLRQDGGRLALQLHLEPQEAKKLFEGFAREIASKPHASAQGE